MRLRLTRAGRHHEISSDEVDRVVATRDLILEPSGELGLWIGMAGGLVVYAREFSADRLATGPAEPADFLVLRRLNGDLRQAWFADRVDWVSKDPTESKQLGSEKPGSSKD